MFYVVINNFGSIASYDIINNNNYKIYIALNLNKYPKALYNSIDKNIL